MQFNEIFEKTKYAFEHDEVFELLTGQKGYAYLDRTIAASVPTMINFVFEDGIFPYYKSSNAPLKESILNDLKAAIQKLLTSNNEVDVWWALFILRSIKNAEARFLTSPFNIADCFWDDARTALLQIRDRLCTNKAFFGSDYPDGLFGDVRRINRLLVIDFGIDILGGDKNG